MCINVFCVILKGDYVIKAVDLSHNNFCNTGGEHLGQMLGNADHLIVFSLQILIYNNEYTKT